MDRTILNAVPFGWLSLIVLVVAVVIGVGGFTLLRRLVPSIAAHAEQRILSSAFAISASLFCFLLAFTIGQLYTNYAHANGDVKQEANALEAVLRGAHGLPASVDATIDKDALAYAGEVRGREWTLMRTGRVDVRAWEDIDRIYGALQTSRRHVAASPFFAQMLSAVSNLAATRQLRLDDIDLSIPALFKLLLLGGALLAIYGTFYFQPFGEPLQVIMIGAASAMIGIALLLAFALDYPYSGGVTVSSAPFNQSTLLVLAGER